VRSARARQKGIIFRKRPKDAVSDRNNRHRGEDRVAQRERAGLSIEGIVQGVGFRPFVYRLAIERKIDGWVLNSPAGVEIEAEGDRDRLHDFIRELRTKAPPLATITDLTARALHVTGIPGFTIRDSDGAAARMTLIAPDIGICDDCLRELFDPSNRRYRYPFINCTNCGPRYTIIEDIPYDRPFTTMKKFAMCPACRAEYENPDDRRFHAQPNACPLCGPRVTMIDETGRLTEENNVIEKSVALLKNGKIVAVKGLGGFHLCVDAANEDAVKRLRERKRREAKALAVMTPDLAAAAALCRIGPDEAALLDGRRKPIVLLEKSPNAAVAEAVAPGNRFLGVMLPYTPLHHLLLRGNFNALVMTSGNITDEPIAIDNKEAQQRLNGIADAFLVHDRDIFLRTDDSVTRIFRGVEMPLRRSRGYVPAPVRAAEELFPILAVGAELKSTVALSKRRFVFLSQHIGDLENLETYSSFVKTIEHLERILEIAPLTVAHDLHPDYMSTRYALERRGIARVGVQHHHAHCASCMAEHALEGKVIGVAFDGTGFGTDGAIWGGEFLVAGYEGFTRKAHLRYASMPGGDAAVKEPFRMAVSHLYGAYGENFLNKGIGLFDRIPRPTVDNLVAMIDTKTNTPLTSSMGRLFDAVSALIGVRERVVYEGQAAIELERLAAADPAAGVYEFGYVNGTECREIDPSPLIVAVTDDLLRGVAREIIAVRFHYAVARMTVTACEAIREETGLSRVVLSGGVFQNYFLLNATVDGLVAKRFEVFTHRTVPTNDGGIALGQLMVANEKVKVPE
jgi:hydrogenase maturation protein HypF